MIHDGVEPSAASAVLHHHQRMDGSGFPECIMTDGTKQVMAGNKIHIFARIIAVADVYDRLATARNSTQRRSNLEILHRIRSEFHTTWLDATIVKALHGICPPYPPGSRVKLSNGSPAVVVHVDSGNPYRPVVKLLLDDEGTLSDDKLTAGADGAPGITHINNVSVEHLQPTTSAEPAAMAGA